MRKQPNRGMEPAIDARVTGRIGPGQKAEVRRMCDAEGRNLAEIAALFRVSVKTVRRV